MACTNNSGCHCKGAAFGCTSCADPKYAGQLCTENSLRSEKCSPFPLCQWCKPYHQRGPRACCPAGVAPVFLQDPNYAAATTGGSNAAASNLEAPPGLQQQAADDSMESNTVNEQIEGLTDRVAEVERKIDELIVLVKDALERL